MPTPSARVVQFWFPNTRVTARGHARAGRRHARGLAQDRLHVVRRSVVLVPAPPRTPPVFWLPAETISMLVPMLAICSCTCCWAPWPRLTIAITAATPMTMPSIVSDGARLVPRQRAQRNLQHRTDHDVLLSSSAAAPPVRPRRREARSTGRSETIAAVAHGHDALRETGDVRLVRHQHDRDAALAIQSLKYAMMSSDVRVSRLPVGSSASSSDGLFTSARAIATRCCWPPESWFGLAVLRGVPAPPMLSAARLRRARSVSRHPGVDQRQLHVLERGRAPQQVEALEHEADLAVADVGALVAVQAAKRPRLRSR